VQYHNTGEGDTKGMQFKQGDFVQIHHPLTNNAFGEIETTQDNHVWVRLCMPNCPDRVVYQVDSRYVTHAQRPLEKQGEIQ